MGNNREIWSANTKKTLQRTQYYPSGLPWASKSTDKPGLQPNKYNGKEFVEMHGLDSYDYGARGYYAATGRFMTVDPMAEKYYSISPYAYCGGNIVNRIDPTGLEWYWNDDGKNPVWIDGCEDVDGYDNHDTTYTRDNGTSTDYFNADKTSEHRLNEVTVNGEGENWVSENIGNFSKFPPNSGQDPYQLDLTPDVITFTVSVDAGFGPFQANFRPAVLSYINVGNDRGWYHQAGGGVNVPLPITELNKILKLSSGSSVTVGVNFGYVIGGDPNKLTREALNGKSYGASFSGGEILYGGVNGSITNLNKNGYLISVGGQIGIGYGGNISVTGSGLINSDATKINF